MKEHQLPSNYEELVNIITSEYESLSKRLKQIASYALENPNEFAIDTIAVTAEKADVQPSALVRFAKAFHFSGFSELQKIFQNRLLAEKPSYEARLKALSISENRSPKGLLEQFAQADIAALQHLQEEMSSDLMESAIRLLERADTIYIMAMRRTFTLGSFIFYSLSSMGWRVQLIDNVGGLHEQQAGQIRETDALIAISYSGYTPYVVETAAKVHAAGVPVIALTDRKLSPLTQSSSVCFHVEEPSVHDFRSLNASMCLIQALVVGLGVQKNILDSSDLPS